MIEQMKVVGGAGNGDTDPSDGVLFLKSLKEGKRRGVVDSLEALTPERKRVIFAGVCMCLSMKTVLQLEKGEISVTSKTIS